ncbi:putative ribonuclease 3-like [Capsicum annuum]|nr:putative ribonuclease 3-like [Capsicum annuum]
MSVKKIEKKNVEFSSGDNETSVKLENIIENLVIVQRFTADIVNKLTVFWPSLTTQDPKEMWKAAWTTYGTCLSNYFNRAIRFNGEIGGGNLLQGQNQKEVSFTCKNINATHAYLNQVSFCYTNDAKNYKDCPASVISQRCNVPNIIVPRPSPPTARASSIQDLQTGEKVGPNVLWETLGQLF